jgi:hypothetical protein
MVVIVAYIKSPFKPLFIKWYISGMGNHICIFGSWYEFHAVLPFNTRITASDATSLFLNE